MPVIRIRLMDGTVIPDCSTSSIKFKKHGIKIGEKNYTYIPYTGLAMLEVSEDPGEENSNGKQLHSGGDVNEESYSPVDTGQTS